MKEREDVAEEETPKSDTVTKGSALEGEVTVTEESKAEESSEVKIKPVEVNVDPENECEKVTINARNIAL